MLGQLFLDGSLRIPESHSGGRLCVRLLEKLRRIVTSVWDPLVRFELDGYPLLMPLSHSLPMVKKRYPDYSENLGRVAAAVVARHPGALIVDIGANVGDSIAIIRAHCHSPILGIEADPRYLRIMERNLPALGGDLHVFGGFVATTSGSVRGELVTGKGTGHLSHGSAGHTESHSLEDILRRFPHLGDPRLIKIDTDGFDTAILQGALEYLARARPVLFFEYDPFFIDQQGGDGRAVLAALRGIGYDNFGDLLLATQLGGTQILEDLHVYYSGRNGFTYMDLCLIPDSEVSLFESLRLSEREHVSRRRTAGKST